MHLQIIHNKSSSQCFLNKLLKSHRGLQWGASKSVYAMEMNGHHECIVWRSCIQKDGQIQSVPVSLYFIYFPWTWWIGRNLLRLENRLYKLKLELEYLYSFYLVNSNQSYNMQMEGTLTISEVSLLAPFKEGAGTPEHIQQVLTSSMLLSCRDNRSSGRSELPSPVPPAVHAQGGKKNKIKISLLHLIVLPNTEEKRNTFVCCLLENCFLWRQTEGE